MQTNQTVQPVAARARMMSGMTPEDRKRRLTARHAELAAEGQRLADSDDVAAFRAHVTRLHQLVREMLAIWGH